MACLAVVSAVLHCGALENPRPWEETKLHELHLPIHLFLTVLGMGARVLHTVDECSLSHTSVHSAILGVVR